MAALVSLESRIRSRVMSAVREECATTYKMNDAGTLAEHVFNLNQCAEAASLAGDAVVRALQGRALRPETWDEMVVECSKRYWHMNLSEWRCHEHPLANVTEPCRPDRCPRLKARE